MLNLGGVTRIEGSLREYSAPDAQGSRARLQEGSGVRDIDSPGWHECGFSERPADGLHEFGTS